MRRLPIYFLVDTCLSMRGRPIEMVENCINESLKSMKGNPQALETNEVNVISYGNNKVTFLEESKSIPEINYQNFNCSGLSNINYGLEAVREDHNKNFKKTTIDKKGDWKPMLFVFTGIAPSTKIDDSLLNFFEKNFSHGYLEYIDSFLSEELEYIKPDKANYIIIVTSENNYTKNSYENYFSNVFSYEDLGSFVQNFNNFFKWIS
jgi:uncharacterized protein YegL